ncbi:DNA mismatch repair endonuclease MutL [Tepidibacillus infernus]|uniref:DNA mismatch repair endonuclease MutL n=1 Tax=Tepidibacillus infernus TaxID=1806172 RepID=UPI003B751980
MITLGKIIVLDDHIANQIAAGEVVERPASIVKELIENSIDARSTKIEIEIEEGGLSLIRIKDNGEGMDEDDVDKAFFRHATSKIKTGKDLFKIRTLGFRGEALPSIAAVSRLILKTSSNEFGKGVEIQLEGGKITQKKEISYTRGTEIIVRDVFYNTPARLKYMKSLQTELAHITDYVNRLSLAYPYISFTLIHNERLLLRTSGDDKLLHVVASIYGTNLAKNMVEIVGEDLDFKVTGYVAKPEITRANKNHISIFINGRYIKNYLLSQSIIKGFNTLLMVNRFPIAIVYIEMDSSLVDVNVHPAKLEVRFSKEQELMKLIEDTVYKALNQQAFIREPLKSSSGTFQKPVQEMFDLTLNYEKGNSENKISSTQRLDDRIDQTSLQDNQVVFTKEENLTYGRTIEQQQIEKTITKLPLLDPIAQFQGTYIIAQSEKGLYLIDQHAAHERIYFEKNLALMNEEIGSSQELLVPITMDFPKSEMIQIMMKLDLFKKYGLQVEAFGMQTLMFRSIPQWIPKGEEHLMIEKMIQMVLHKNEINLEELRQEMIATTSCKTAIKANHYLTKQEMEQLLEQLRQTNNPFSCPHGRPVIIHFSTYEIEKMFKRVI